MFDYFYNHSLRKLVVGFGSLFNNIQIAHTDPDTSSSTNIRVPIHYGPQEKFIQRLLQPSSITPGTRIELQVPVISFIMNSVASDPSRRLSRFPNQGGSCPTPQSQIPVNVSFSLLAYTRHTDDMLQIVEQIMPYFLPDHVITMDFTEGAGTNVNIPIVMVSNNLTEKYEGDLASRRLNIASFQFIAKSWIFGEVRSTTSIQSVDTSGTNIIFD